MIFTALEGSQRPIACARAADESTLRAMDSSNPTKAASGLDVVLAEWSLWGVSEMI